jgi:predicted alpha/beta superfamily hydrolase
MRRSAFLIPVVVLLAVCGLPTADDAAERDETARLQQELAPAQARLTELERSPDGGSVLLADTEVRELTSRVSGRSYLIKIKLPRGYSESAVSYPVLYSTDAETNFGGVSYIVQRLIKDKIIPEILVVGIAYDTDYETFYDLRTLDLAPARDTSKETGAEAFNRFLEDELFPFVERNYRASGDGRALYGHSLGGLFGFHVLLNRGQLFDRYLLLSPSLWWQCKAIFDDVGRDLQGAATKRLYVATGELENRRHHCRDQSMVDHQREMVRLLEERGLENLVIESEILDRETHRTIFGRGFTNGLRSIYSDR